MINLLRNLRDKTSANLGREDKVLLWQPAQDSPKTVFGLALAVERRSVEIADPAIISGCDSRIRLRIGQRRVVVA
jgi:hypothetical protein